GESHMRYLCLIYSDENAPEVPGVSDWDTMMKTHGAFSEEAGPAGVILGGEALQPTSTATTIRDQDGQQVITDGPFAETKEQLGGFFLIEAKDIDEACAVAARFPPARLGTVEVRPVQELEHS
ncbi:MAG TPA: YciI family protein, partial [Methylomirabilota bacterium]|nr:YciI family protein [Methylomirabilota bacterium]